MPAAERAVAAARASRWPRALGAVTALVALGGLLGWIVDSALLKTTGGISAAINPGSAVILFLGGLGLWVQASAHGRKPGHRWLALGCAAGVVALSVARLGELSFQWPTAVDRFLVPGRFEGVPNESPLRISGALAVLFVVAGIGALLVALGNRTARVAGRAAAMFIAAIAALGVLGFVANLGSPKAAEPKAAVTVILLLLFSAGTASLGGIRERAEAGSEAVRALRRRVVITLRVAIGLLVVTSGLAVRGAMRSQEAARNRHDAAVLRDGLNGLVATVLQAESSQRGFLLTAEPSVKRRYELAADSARTKLAALSDSSGTRPGRSERMAELGRNLDLKLAELAVTVDLRTRGMADSAFAVVRSGAGIAAMAAIRRTATELIEDGNAQVSLWDQRLKLDNQVSMAMSLLGGALAILFLVLAGGTIGRDLEDRAKIETALRASEARLSQVVALNPNMVFLKDPETLKFTLFNRAGTELLGFTESEMVGHEARELFPAAEAERSYAIDRSVLESHEVFEQTAEVVHSKTGEERILHTKRVAVRDPSGKPLFILGIAEDITDRLAAEAAIRDAKEAAERANLAKSEFLAKMSHELRTPLNSIIGFSEILSEGRVGPLNDKQRRYVGNVLVSGRNLLQLINDILDLSKVEAGRMELALSTFEVRPALEQIGTILEAVAEKKHLAVTVSVDDDVPAITADRGKLAQVMFNLVGNAVKFTPEHGQVSIKARVVDSDQGAPGRWLEIAVTDTGIGIPEAHLEKIFREFEQVPRPGDSTLEGTGLGLALARRMVELHGGRIWVTSAVGQGTTFAFLLPYQGAAAAVEPITPAQGGPLVLVVDDEPQARDLLTHYLRDSGFRVAVAASSAAAVAMAAELRPAAITLDVLMPGKDGFDVLAALKRADATRDIPVVVVSVTDQCELGFSLGAADWLVKPVQGSALLDSLKRVIGSGPAPGRTIVVIEDQPSTVEYLEGVLSREGYTVASSMTGWGGVDLVIGKRPDAVILDLMLPDLTGFDVAKVLRAHPDAGHIPILILTAKDLSKAEEASLRRSVQSIVRKGGGEDLVGELGRLTGLREAGAG